MVDKVLDFLENSIVAIMFGFISIEVFAQIIFRLFGVPLAFTEESARYILVFLTFIASSRAVKEDRHLSVGILPLLLPNKGKNVLKIIGYTLCCLFCIFILYYGIISIKQIAVFNQKSPTMRINMAIPYTGPIFGSGLMLLRYIQSIFKTVSANTNNRE